MQLRPYQIQGASQILRILEKRSSAYLADEMGLGKTCQAISVMNKLCLTKILIVCPASLRLNWKKELMMWGRPESCIQAVLKGTDIKGRELKSIVIISYDIASTKEVLPLLRNEEWDMVVFDEAHYLKSPKSARTKACLSALWPRCTYKLALSGTPLPNGVIDGFTVFHKMAPEMFPDYHKFGMRYTQAKRNYFTGYWEYRGGRNLSELRAKVRSTFMVRRAKKTVLSELPPKIYSTVPIEVKGAPACLDEETLAAVQRAITEGEALSASAEIATQRRALGHLKIASIIDYVKMLLISKEKVVLFLYHREVIKVVREAFPDSVAIYGGVSPVERQVAIEKFQTDSKVKLFVGQITAAGVGITLTAADICVFGELDWVPASMAQAIDRLHRIGQYRPVDVHYLVAERSMDSQIIGSLRSKIESINEVLKDERAKRRDEICDRPDKDVLCRKPAATDGQVEGGALGSVRETAIDTACRGVSDAITHEKDSRHAATGGDGASSNSHTRGCPVEAE